MAIKLLHSVLGVFALMGCQLSDEKTDYMPACDARQVCAYIYEDADRIFIGVANDSEDIIYMPWINGAVSIVSGFSVNELSSSGADVRAKEATPTPTEIPLVGIVALVPNSSYGVSVLRSDAQAMFKLKAGCQTVVAEFRALPPEVIPPGKLVTSAISKPTQICL